MDDELWLKAARVLAGRPTSVRFRQPVCADYDGQAYIINGEAVIDIKPGFDDQTVLYIFTHEAAHIRLGTAPVSDPAKPGSQQLTALGTKLRKIHPVVVEQESGADRLSSVWMNYAKRHYVEYSGESILERELKALAGYISPELQAKINRAALKSATEAIKTYKLRR